MSDTRQFAADVVVHPRPEILDPQGKAIRSALDQLGFEGVSEVRAGKSFHIRLEASSESEARAAVEAMCDKLLANPIVEDSTFELVAEGAEDG